MRPNPLRERWTSGEVALGGWLAIPSSVSAEVLGAADFDYVNVDLQHGLVGYSDLVPMLQAIQRGTPTPVVRVPWNEPGIIGKALDAGAMAVIVPMVNSREECEAAVRATRYAPGGARSYGPNRVGAVEGPDYFDRANADVACIPMVETAQAIDAIDDIVSVDGVDAIYVGPADLAISMGFRPGTDDPAFDEALATIVASCDRHGVVPGIHGTASLVADRTERGFRMISLGSDLVALRAGVANDLAIARQTGGAGSDSIY